MSARTVANLPRVAITDSPVTLPGFALPPLQKRRMGWIGDVYFREVAIPLPAEVIFKDLWKKEKPNFLRRGFTIRQDGGAWKLSQWLAGAPGAHTLTERGAEILAAATRTQGTLALVDAPLVLPELPDGMEKKLFGYQVEPTRQLLRALQNGMSEWGFPGAADMSDMGVGKTAMDLAAALATGRKPVVLCPVVGKGGWEWMFNHFGAEPHFIGTYEGLRMGNRPHIAEERDGKFYWQNASEIALIMDECQAVRHDDTLNFKLCSGAIRQGIPIITASATIALSPLEMRFAGRITGLHQGGPDWERFLYQHGCARPRKDAAFKWDGKLHHLVRIHSQLFPRRGCRVRKEDLGDACPETSITVLPIDCEEAGEIERLWREGNDFIDLLERQHATARAVEAARMKMYMACWKASEIAMVPHIAAMTRQKVREGRSVAIFMGFTESRLLMSRALKTHAGFYGGMPQQRRAYWAREFQANREHILVSQIGAGGASVSLHDTTGDRPRTAFIFPHNNTVWVQQATGRVDRVGGQTTSEQFIPCIRGELSERMVNSMRTKIRRIATLNDGAAAVERF